MQFSLPDEAKKPLLALTIASEPVFAPLLKAVRESEPTLGIEKFCQSVDSRLEPSPLNAQIVLKAIAGMYLASHHAAMRVADFVDDVLLIVAGLEEFRDVEGGLDILRNRVGLLLSCHETLGISAKSMALLLDQEHALYSARILTDVRHVFGEDPSKVPTAAVVFHELNLVYREYSGMKDLYVALDCADIKRLMKVFQRALDKEETLRTTIKNAGIKFLGDD